MAESVNERCPFQADCGLRCAFEAREIECPYYASQAGGEYTIPDQEARRVELLGRDESRYEGQYVEPEEPEKIPPYNHGPNIVEIPLGLLYPHPDNPRKDVGDLMELADSIRANGILQNLTVVENGEEEREGTFTVIIGHRRLEAAKLAGVQTVPCAIVDMTPEQQIATMLAENIQREALTPYEEAMGFQQLRMDFGKTVGEIAEMSGFSESTVRNRLKLAKLDPDKFKASESRGATLADYMRLDEIRDDTTRNAVLDKIGTPDFENELAKAVAREKKKEIISRFESAVSSFAVKIERVNWDTMEHVRSYETFNIDKEVEMPEDTARIAYYYTVTSYGITVYRDKQVREDTPDDPEEIRKRELHEATESLKQQLNEIMHRHFELRKRFVSGCLTVKKTQAAIMAYAAETMLGDRVYCDTSLLGEILGVYEDAEHITSVTALREYLVGIGYPRSEAGVLLCVAYAATDGYYNGYWKSQWRSEIGEFEYAHKENQKLDRLYKLITDLGYEMSDEERQMQDGTHPLFRQREDSETVDDGE